MAMEAKTGVVFISQRRPRFAGDTRREEKGIEQILSQSLQTEHGLAAIWITDFQHPEP